MTDSGDIVVYDSTGYGWGNITVNSGTAAATNGNVTRIIVQSSGGTQTSIEKPLVESKTEKRVSPKLYFSYVKSKLQKNEIKALKVRLAKLQTFTKDAFDVGQQALYEEYAKQMAICVRESEAYVCGYDKWVTINDIERFRDITKEADSTGSPVFFKKLEDFPRSIPYKTKTQVTQVKDKKIFDQLWVLYLDYTKTELKTNKEKIREKDPILFGQFAYQKDRYYYILDWVDEHCDLTLEKFVETMSAKDPHYKVQQIPEIDCDFVEKIKKEVMDRHERLGNTKRDNFRQLMEEEDPKRPPPLPPSSPGVENYTGKKPWYKRMFGKKV